MKEGTLFKMIIVGNERVGKSDIIKRLTDGVFKEHSGFEHTIGVDFSL